MSHTPSYSATYTRLGHILHCIALLIHPLGCHTQHHTWLLHSLGALGHILTTMFSSIYPRSYVTHSIAHVTRYLGWVTYSITLCATYARPCHILIASHTLRHPLGHVPHTLLHPIGYVTHNIAHFTTSIGLCHIQHCTLCYIH